MRLNYIALYTSQVPEIPSPNRDVMDHGNINNYVLWAATATITGVLLYIVIRFIPWLITQFSKALKEETEACRLERESQAKAAAEEREKDRMSRHEIASRMQSGMADACLEFRATLKGIWEDSDRRTQRIEGALDRQTDSITGALRSQTEIILNKNGGRKTRAQLDLQQVPNNLDPPIPTPKTPFLKP